LVGIITHDDVLDILQEEATEDAHRQGAVQPLEDGYLETPLRTIIWKRGVWLLFLAIVALFTAQVLRSYETASEAYVWIIWFLPLVLASGGNAGSQSATLVIRTIALGELEDRENVRMAQRELILGLGLGLALATLGFAAAVFSFGRTAIEATVVGLTVLLVVVMGTVSGALLPIGFKRLGMDPALMSNPLIAALVDVLGVIIYYSVAATLLSSLS
jgi:magnesium transporter